MFSARNLLQGLPSGLVAKTSAPSAGDPGSVSGQETRSHRPQLTVHVLPLKIPCATINAWYNQINIFLKDVLPPMARYEYSFGKIRKRGYVP